MPQRERLPPVWTVMQRGAWGSQAGVNKGVAWRDSSKVEEDTGGPTQQHTGSKVPE